MNTYLTWLTEQTPTSWRHDFADPQEVDLGAKALASGVTTNPVLAARTAYGRPEYWLPLAGPLAGLSAQERAERLTQVVACDAARKVAPHFSGVGGKSGYVCAQVDPTKQGDRDTMLSMARRFHAWAPNIAVRLPVTAAGLDVLEDCIAEGITCTATVGFTVPQVVQVAERHRQGAERARAAGITPGDCFAVIMIGRLDDYLRDVAHDRKAGVSESDIRQAGLAVIKRAYRIHQEQDYEAVLLIAAMRAAYHITELAGAELIMSVYHRVQAMLEPPDVPREVRFERPISPEVIA